MVQKKRRYSKSGNILKYKLNYILWTCPEDGTRIGTKYYVKYPQNKLTAAQRITSPSVTKNESFCYENIIFGINSLKGTRTDNELRIVWISLQRHPQSLP